MDPIVVICIQKIRNKRNKITHYRLRDDNGVEKVVTSGELHNAIRTKSVECVNLKLASDGRIISIENDYVTFKLKLSLMGKSKDYQFRNNGKTFVRYTGDSAIVKIPDFVEEIGVFCFGSNPTMTEVIIPKSVKVIHEYAFDCCEKLRTVTGGENIETIEPSAFFGCAKLENISIPRKLKIINNDVFMGCTNLKNIVIPDNIQSIHERAFLCASNLVKERMVKTRLIIGKGVKMINNLSFVGRYIEYLYIQGTPLINPGAFTILPIKRPDWDASTDKPSYKLTGAMVDPRKHKSEKNNSIQLIEYLTNLWRVCAAVEVLTHNEDIDDKTLKSLNIDNLDITQVKGKYTSEENIALIHKQIGFN